MLLTRDAITSLIGIAYYRDQRRESEDKIGGEIGNKWGGKKVHCGKCTKEKRNFVFIFRSNFNVMRIYPRVLLKKKKERKGKKK